MNLILALQRSVFVAIAAAKECCSIAEFAAGADVNNLRESYGVLRQKAELAELEHEFKSANANGSNLLLQP